MKSISNINQLTSTGPELVKDLQDIIDTIDFKPDSHGFYNIMHDLREIAYVAFNTNWDFIIQIMRQEPLIATAAVFAAYDASGFASSIWCKGEVFVPDQDIAPPFDEDVWRNTEFIPRVRDAIRNSEIKFANPNRFCVHDCSYSRKPWTFEKVSQIAKDEVEYLYFNAKRRFRSKRPKIERFRTHKH